MYKMIILDLDGTLLNDYKEVSKENIELIERAYKEKGIISVIATGRPLEYAKGICNLYSSCFANYIIACNGAIIEDINTNKYIHKVTFSNEEIIKLRNIFLDEKAAYMMVYTDKQAIIEVRDSKELENTGVDKEASEIGNIEEIIKNNKNVISLLGIIGGETRVLEKITNRINMIEDIEPSVICNYLYKTGSSTFESKYIDINKNGCSKKNAICILADKLKIKQEEIIVMGDGGNDISMFECAGIKIAMENAEEYLKEKADFITTSNNNSGVAKAIRKFIFNEE